MALTEDKLQQKQAQLIERTSRALAISLDEAEQLLRIKRQQSLRINTLKAQQETTVAQLRDAGVAIQPIPWIGEGYEVLDGLDIVRDGDMAKSGAVYIQNAASWLPVLALDVREGDTVLDVCAAPGGKTSHIAQYAGNTALITANDNSRPRLHKLQRNLERLNVENVTFTLHDATRLARHMEGESFDKILLDAPCSGEGMMTLDTKKDFESWSVAHIKRLQQLQKKLIVQAWQLLKPGGTLVYSTCTMAPEENEAVVDYLLRHNTDVRVESLEGLKKELDNAVAPVLSWNDKTYSDALKNAIRLAPSAPVEAFFVVKLTKAFEA